METPTPHIEEKPIHITADRIAETDLKPGVVIEGLANPQQIDSAIEEIAIKLGCTPYTQFDKDDISVFSSRIDRPSYFLKEMAAKTKYYGRLENGRLTILAEDLTIISPASRKDLSKFPGPTITYRITTDMHPTGKGITGQLECDVCMKPLGARVALYKRPYKPSQTTRATQQVIDTSLATAENIERDNLRKISSAGLPGLGKRK